MESNGGVGSSLIEAKKIIQTAEEKAQTLILNAKLEIEKLKNDAILKGVEEGKREIFDQILKINSVEFKIKVENLIAELSLTVAAELIEEEISLNPEKIIEITRRAVATSGDPTDITISVNKDDLETVKKSLPSFQAEFGKNNIKLLEDPTLKRGGVVVKSELGEVDLSLETLISRVKHHFGLS